MSAWIALKELLLRMSKFILTVCFGLALVAGASYLLALKTMKERLREDVTQAYGLTPDQMGHAQKEFVLDIGRRNPALATRLAGAQVEFFESIEDSRENRVDQNSAIADNMLCAYRGISWLCERAHTNCSLMLAIPAKGVLVGLDSDGISWLEKRETELKLVKLRFGISWWCPVY